MGAPDAGRGCEEHGLPVTPPLVGSAWKGRELPVPARLQAGSLEQTAWYFSPAPLDSVSRNDGAALPPPKLHEMQKLPENAGALPWTGRACFNGLHGAETAHTVATP